MSAGGIDEAMECEAIVPKDMDVLCEDVMSKERKSSEIFNNIWHENIKGIHEK